MIIDLRDYLNKRRKTKEEKWKEMVGKLCLWHKWFAWYPVKPNSGLWIWFSWTYRRGYYLLPHYRLYNHKTVGDYLEAKEKGLIPRKEIGEES